ncbi:DUF2079 domain-containing protein [Actinoallomurus rhizosphaericola]|uniref:DUF2079 domain-containing protein n=1 Tax=Actinoallomurus rhizosphaericola TaxID=2952536 RepID=UPI002091226E|nr:DUF2079 domain-containing protein [Actinoallomurus rhizosphaericola]MCO5992166.1 DUF2079 domain-containing protein [Actinoallomurus rhizosphaericola]
MITVTPETTGPEVSPGPARRDAVVVGALVVAAAAVYSVFALVRYRTFRTTTYDLVIFDQAVRSYSRFHLPTAIVKGVHNGFGPHFSVLGDHFSPILVVLAPLYWIHDGPQTLLVAQAVLLALTIVPLWMFTRRRLGAWAAHCVAGVYALAWPVAETVAFDFHEMAFTPLLSMLMLERHDAGRRRQCLLAASALLLVKEDMGLLVAGFGLYLLTRPGERRLAAVFVAAGLGWTWLASRVLIPAFGGAADYYWAYDALGRDLPHAAAHALTHPWTALKLLVTPGVKATTMAWLILPLLLVPLASPITIAVLPLLVERMLANRFGNWWEPRFHYNVALTALLVAAGVDGACRLSRLRLPGPRARRLNLPPGSRARRLRLDLLWPVAALLAAVVVVPRFAFKNFFDPAFYRRDAHARAAADAVAAVPRGALVEAANVVGPQLSGRARVLLWDTRVRWAPWVVADTARATFPFPALGAQRDRVRYLLQRGYTMVLREDGWVVLHDPAATPDLRATR